MLKLDNGCMGNDTILPNFVYGYFEKKKFLKSHKYIVTLLFIFVLIFFLCTE